MKKRILSTLLALCMVLSLLPAEALAQDTTVPTSGTCGENLTWTLENGTLTITGLGTMDDFSLDTSTLAPWYDNAASIETVIIEDGATSIGDYAFFYLENLSNIIIPSSITKIGNYAFEVCKSLANVAIPNRVVSIGDSAFLGCDSLKGIIIPDSVVNIGKDAFSSCKNLENVTISGHITSIESHTFSGCSNLKNVIIPDSVTSIGDWAFQNCTSLSNIDIPDHVTYIGEYAFCQCYSLESITIPSGVVNIGDYTFSICKLLTNVVIPNGVTGIGQYAFQACDNMTNITLPDSVTSIGYKAFWQCSNLEDVYYSGSESEWANIDIDDYDGNGGNYSLIYANIHFNSTGPDDPGDGGLELGDQNTNWTVAVGETLKVTAQMADGSAFDAEKLQWSLSDAGIAAFAEIVDSGLEGSTAYAVLQGVRPGKTTLTASMPSMTAPGVIDVNPIRVSQEITVIGQENIRFDQDTYTVMVGKTIDNITVSIPNPNGLTFNDINFNCISSDSEIASVTSWKGPDIDNGQNPISITVGVKGSNVGTATITASVGDGRSASCEVIVGEKADVGFKPVTGPTYRIKVEKSGRSYAPVPTELKGKEISWEWKSSDGSIVSFNQNGILGEMGGEGKLIVSDEISEQFYARAVGTVTLTCSIDGTTIFKQDVIVTEPDNNSPTIDSNDYNVQLRDNAEEIFNKEFEVVETSYKKLLNRMDEKLDKPENIYPVVNPSIEEQALALLTHDKDKKQKEKFLLFSPSTPDELKLCCYHVFCEQLFNAAKDAGFSLKDISLGDPYQTALITKMAKFAGEKLDDDFPMIDSNGRKVTVEANFVSYPIGDATGLGTMKCYYDSNPYKSYTCYLLPAYSSAEQSMKAYLQELIDLEYRAIKNIRSALVEDLISFDLKTLGEKGAAKVLDVMHKEAGALEEYKLLGLDGTISSCYDYGKEVLKLKSKIANSPTDIKGIAEGIEQLSQWEVPEVGNILKREVTSLKSAQKNFQQKIWSKLISKELPDWADRFIRVVLKCPVNVSVLKSDQLIGYAGDDDFWYNDGIVIEEYGDAKIIYYNPADNISFEITGTADGSMSYTVEEFSNGSPTGRINSDIILVAKGQVFTARFPDKDLEQNQTEFSLTSNGETIQPMEYISVSDSAPVDISVTIAPTNSGNVYGSGTYVRGDAAVLYESPADGYVFSGWYDISGNLVSQSPVYEFSAMENRALEARFAVSSNIPDDDSASDFQIYLISFDPNGGTMESYLKITNENNCLDDLPIPVHDNYAFDGWYTALDGGEKVDENYIYTANTTLYAHWIEDSKTEHTHNWATVWTSDANGHWHNCTAENCPVTVNNQKDGYAAHISDGGKVTTAATSYQNGVRTYSCTVCGYVIRTESIPATGGSSSSGGSSSNGSSSGGSGIASYPITADSSAHGSVSFSPKNASKGTVVTITVTPDIGYELEKLTVTDRKDNELELADKGDGKYTFTMPTGAVKIKAAFVLTEMPWSSPFTDVAEGAWCYDAVRFVSENGLMNGIGSSLFAPDANLSRAQLAQILYNKEGKPAVNGESNFQDVAAGTWCADAVTWAAAQGIVGGYGNGMFGPDDPITREQLAVMLWRYSDSPAATNKELHFSDAGEAGGYALDALCWAVESGIINGYGDGRLGPKGFATRAQVAQMLKNYLDR